MATLRSLLLGLLLALLCSFQTPLAPSASVKAQDLPFIHDDDDDDYHEGSICSLCAHCEHCDSCDKCPCKKGDDSEHCDFCDDCGKCYMCPVCETVCKPGGFVDSVSGSIYKTVADVLDGDDDDDDDN